MESHQISRAQSYRISLLNEAKFDSLVQNRDGKILLINVWATWCVPCREEFPNLVRLTKVYQGKDVDIIGISADFPDEIDDKIIPFLMKQKVNFENYLQNFRNQEDFINKLSPEWQGALPATFVYDTSGKMREFLLGKQTYESFQNAIEKHRIKI
jgi:thiol-disulfide isomerase/thioredoxin